MLESSTLLHKLCSLIVGSLVVVLLLLIGARGVTAATSSTGFAGVSGNPNVVAGSMAASITGVGDAINKVGYDSGQAALHTGHTLSHDSQVAASTTLHGARFIGLTTVHSLRFCGAMIWHGTTFVGRNVFGGVLLMANTTSRTMAFLADTAATTPLTKAADTANIPIIKPLDAGAMAVQVASKQTPASPVPAATAAAPVVAAAPPLPIHDTTVASASRSQAESNDLYAWGNCTWWVFIRRFQIGDSIPNTWGNATNWAYASGRDGYLVDHHPTPGSIMQISGVDYGLGHVAFVESVDPDGTWHISEMNVQGLDVVDNKAEPASAAAYYSFIHDKQ
jgi:surface antigen